MIWVIGCDGLLGSTFCKILDARHFSWVGTASELNTENAEALENFFKSTETKNYLYSHNNPEKDFDGGKIKWIINCEEEKSIKSVENIARLARSHGSKLIHFSSDCVFDGKKQEPYEEDDKKNPLSEYAMQKSQEEDAIIKTMTQYYIIRTSKLFAQEKDNFVSDIALSFNSNSERNFSNDENFSLTNAKNVCEVALKFIEKTNGAKSFFGKKSAPSFGIYHYTDNGSATEYEYAKLIYELLKKYKKQENECTISAFSKTEKTRLTLSCKKITKEFHLKIPSVEDEIESFIKLKDF